MGNTIARVAGCGPADDDDDLQMASLQKPDVEDEDRHREQAELLRTINEYKQTRQTKYEQQMSLQHLVNELNGEVNTLSDFIDKLIKDYRNEFQQEPPEVPTTINGDGDGPRDEANNQSIA